MIYGITNTGKNVAFIKGSGRVTLLIETKDGIVIVDEKLLLKEAQDLLQNLEFAISSSTKENSGGTV